MLENRNAKGLKGFLIASLLFGFGATNSFGATNLKEAIENATISGFGFARITNVHGKDGDGTKWQFRFRPVVTTGEISGWSASAGIFFSKGSSTPDNSNTDTDISSSRGDKFFSSSDVFNISDFYVTFNGSKDQNGTNTKVRLGQQAPNTPFNDVNLDRALGVFIDNNDFSGVKLGLQWWDTWLSDDIYLVRAPYSLASAAAGSGIGNNIFMFYVSSDDNFTKDTGFSYRLYYAYAHRFIDYMVFADAGYNLKINDSNSISFLVQASATGLRHDLNLFGDGILRNVFNNRANRDKIAQNRGMYNVRIDYKYNLDTSSEKPSNVITLSAGFAGSFGDGYGTMLDNTGGLKLGGQLWNSFSGVEANGFGIFGVGTFKNSWIIVPYAKIDWTYKNLGISLDMAYVKTSHFFFLKASGNPSGKNLNTINGFYNEDQSSPNANRVSAASLFEVSPTLTYKFSNSLSATAYYSYAFGTPQLGRFRVMVNYVF